MNGKNLAAAMAAKRQMQKKSPHAEGCDCSMCMGGAAKMAEGGIVEQGTNASDAPSPATAGPNEPGPSAFPREEAEALAASIREAKSYRHMAQGGRVDEHDESHTEQVTNSLGSDMDHYPHTGAEESDTMAQDESFGDGQLKNEDGDMDQEDARKAMRKNRLGGIMSDMRQRHFGKP